MDLVFSSAAMSTATALSLSESASLSDIVSLLQSRLEMRDEDNRDNYQTVHVRRKHVFKDSLRWLRRTTFDPTKPIKV